MDAKTVDTPARHLGKEGDSGTRIPEAWVSAEESHVIDQTPDGPSTFADGSHVAICTSWAIQARRILGDRVRIFGFFCEENPAARRMARIADGHDFALLDDRWILDGWLAHVEAEIETPVLDLEDPGHAVIIAAWYGDRRCWHPGLQLEAVVDAEPEHVRARALSRVIFPDDASSPCPEAASPMAPEM